MLALNTPVPTPTGWTTVADLKPGDEVFDRHGTPTAVISRSHPRTGQPCFVVRSVDGESITTTGDHTWLASPRTGYLERFTTTGGLTDGRARQRTVIRTASHGLTLPAADLPCHPYVLGVWLGNGDRGRPLFKSAEPRIAERIRALGYPCRAGKAKHQWHCITEEESRGREASRVRVELRAAGVLGAKLIPDLYLRASREQRLELLRGLVDVGCKVNPTGQIQLQSKDKHLLDQVSELVYSLGAKASVRPRPTRTGPSQAVQFKLANASSLPEPVARCRDSRSATTRTVWAEPATSVTVRSIRVDSPDGTLLVGRTLLPTISSM